MKIFHRSYGSGQPLVILHGFMGFSDNWVTLGRKWAEEYQVILPDARNHGNSFHSDDFTYKDMVEDLYHLFEEQKLEKAFLMGHSMGGKTAIKFTQEYPDYVDKLIVADMGIKYYPITHDKLLEALLEINLEEYDSRTEVDKKLSQKISNSVIRQFLLKNLNRSDSGHLTWKANIRLLYDKLDNIGEAVDFSKEIEVPTLFIRGENSDYVNDADLNDIKKNFANVNIVTIKKAGHWLHAEQPKAFFDTVSHYLSSK